MRCYVKMILTIVLVFPVHAVASNATCPPDDSLSWKASPYLYPCTIQYCLVAVAILCQMYRNIGRIHVRHVDESRDPDAASTIRSGGAGGGGEIAAVSSTLDDVTSGGGGGGSGVYTVDCDKAHRGLFLGLFVFVLTLVAVSCYFVVGDQLYIGADVKFYSSFILFFTELTLLAVASSAVILGFVRFRRLRFNLLGGDCIETSLLVVALAGVFLLKAFHTVSAVDHVVGTSGGIVAILSVCTSAAVVVQASLQTVFIFDGLRRSVQTPGQAHRKPGRTLVTFLLLVNVSLLVVAVFEVKKVENASIHAAVYGYLAWSVISHVTVPLAIFFRFHSTVCLSDIWNGAYKLKEK